MAAILAGACWGAVLAICSALAMGAGHGVYFPAAIISAPFGALGVIAALIGSVVLWSGFAALTHKRSNAALLLFHYFGTAVICFTTPEYWDFHYFVRLSNDTKAVACAAIGLYAVGQVWLIVVTIKAFTANRTAPV
jgi:hypothetical protein